VTVENFRNTLADQWLTSEALTDSLGKYADETTELGKKSFAAAQDVKTFTQLIDTLKEAAGSGWAQTWELMIGDFEEAKEVWGGVSEALGGLIGRSADARNKVLSDWKQLHGRTALINGIKNVWEALTNVLGPIRNAFRAIFPPMLGSQLADLSKRFEQFTKKLIPSEETMEKIGKVARGMFAALDIGLYVLKMVG